MKCFMSYNYSAYQALLIKLGILFHGLIQLNSKERAHTWCHISMFLWEGGIHYYLSRLF